MLTKEELMNNLNQLKRISTKDEWLVFVLAYYEDLNIAEIGLVLSKDITIIDNTLANVLVKAESIFKENMSILYSGR